MTRMSRIRKIEPTVTSNAPCLRTPLALLLASVVATTCITSMDNEATASSPEAAAQDRGQDRRARGEASSSRELPTAEAIEERVKAGGEIGRFTVEQSQQIMNLHRRFVMGVESGRISADEAGEMFEERYRAIISGRGETERKQEASPSAEEAALANRLGTMMIELGKALETGKITSEQAIERVMGAARRMKITDEGAAKTPADQRKMRAQYAEAEKKMAAMVEKGEITREQMRRRLGEMRRAMAGDENRTITKQDYTEAEKKMAAMVEKGEITREQMEQRLGEMKRIMMESAAKTERTITRQDYAEAEKKMAAMVEKGEITREQMEQRLGEMRRAITSQGQKRERITRQDYAEAREAMEEMVRKGEITREQMQERLDAMRRRMAE